MRLLHCLKLCSLLILLIAPMTVLGVKPSDKVYGPVSPKETLGEIGQKVRGEWPIPLKYVVQAIYELNPESFSEVGINGLYIGSMLAIPDMQALSKEVPELLSKKPVPPPFSPERIRTVDELPATTTKPAEPASKPAPEPAPAAIPSEEEPVATTPVNEPVQTLIDSQAEQIDTLVKSNQENLDTIKELTEQVNTYQQRSAELQSELDSTVQLQQETANQVKQLETRLNTLATTPQETAVPPSILDAMPSKPTLLLLAIPTLLAIIAIWMTRRPVKTLVIKGAATSQQEIQDSGQLGLEITNKQAIETQATEPPPPVDTETAFTQEALQAEKAAAESSLADKETDTGIPTPEPAAKISEAMAGEQQVVTEAAGVEKTESLEADIAAAFAENPIPEIEHEPEIPEPAHDETADLFSGEIAEAESIPDDQALETGSVTSLEAEQSTEDFEPTIKAESIEIGQFEEPSHIGDTLESEAIEAEAVQQDIPSTVQKTIEMEMPALLEAEDTDHLGDTAETETVDAEALEYDLATAAEEPDHLGDTAETETVEAEALEFDLAMQADTTASVDLDQALGEIAEGLEAVDKELELELDSDIEPRPSDEQSADEADMGMELEIASEIQTEGAKEIELTDQVPTIDTEMEDLELEYDLETTAHDAPVIDASVETSETQAPAQDQTIQTEPLTPVPPAEPQPPAENPEARIKAALQRVLREQFKLANTYYDKDEFHKSKVYIAKILTKGTPDFQEKAVTLLKQVEAKQHAASLTERRKRDMGISQADMEKTMIINPGNKPKAAKESDDSLSTTTFLEMIPTSLSNRFRKYEDNEEGKRLALAYLFLDIEELDMAKNLLEEVMDSGNIEFIEEAHSVLAEMSNI